MRREIEVILRHLRDPSRTLSLFYRVRPIPVAERYFAAVRDCAGRFDLLDPDRFHNFPRCPKDRAWIASELNRRIDIVNAHAPSTIADRAEADMDQGLMNRLHVHFEKLRGSVLAPSAFYEAAPIPVQDAINQYNLLIHRYESTVRNEARLRRGIRPAAHAVLTFASPRPRYPFQDEDYRHFELRTVFGSMRINYCELGKPIWDAYLDRDEDIGDDNIRPLRFYSGDALFEFSPSERRRAQLKHKLFLYRWWLGSGGKRLRELGFYPWDPKTSIGHITVANLDRARGRIAGLSEEAIVDLIADHQLLAGVRCHA